MVIKRVNVLFISKRTDQALQLKDSLSGVPGYKVLFVETAEAAMQALTDGKMDCLIFNFENFGLVQVKLAKDLQQVAKVSQVLIFTDSADETIVAQIKDDRTLILVEKPLLNIEKDIGGLTRRIVGGQEPVFKREHVRKAANQKATVTVFGTQRVINGRMVDVSEKGACLEINTNNVEVGEKLKITIELERVRIFNGEIRWVKPFPGRSLIGVRLFKLDSKS